MSRPSKHRHLFPKQGLDHLILILGSLFMLGPLAVVLLGSLNTAGDPLAAYRRILLTPDLFGNGVNATDMMINSFIVAGGIAGLKTLVSILAAFALVCFNLRHRDLIFGLILLPLFFPIETRILPTFLVTSQMGLVNSYGGMILPVVASGLGVLIFRQSLSQIPAELMEAARLDGAGPLRYLFDILLPVSLPMIAALFTILFVLGWNQYLWPLMVATTSEEHYTLVRGIERVGAGSSSGQAFAMLAMLPPLVLMLFTQRWITRGLTLSWK